MIRSGRMRHRFKLLSPKLDDDGNLIRNDYGTPTGETDIVARPWCNIIDNKSSESVGTAINGQETIIFEIRYSKQFINPETNMFIEFENETYDITSSFDPHKRRERLHVTAIKRR